MSKFKNDEVVILTQLRHQWEKYNGEDVTIIKYIGLDRWWHDGSLETYPTYKILFYGEGRYLPEGNLRKKKPPKKQSILDEIEELTGWRPEERVTA